MRRLGVAALLIAALAVGRVVTAWAPSDARVGAPFLRAGTVGAPVALRYADVTATEPVGSRCVIRGVGSTAGSVTPGVFVVVPLVVRAKGEPALLSYAAVVDVKGRTFLTSVGGRSSFGGGGAAQTGVPRYLSVVVELPADAVPGARLRVALNADDQRHDDMADIDLGLTAADAQAWQADPDAVTVADPSDSVPGPRPAQACETGS